MRFVKGVKKKPSQLLCPTIFYKKEMHRKLLFPSNLFLNIYKSKGNLNAAIQVLLKSYFAYIGY